MSTRILVAYSSGTGSTADVAEAIADELRGENVAVQTERAKEVADVTPYDAVVLGSSIRLGRWLPGAIRFLETFGPELREVPVAYFTTCLTMVNDTEESRRQALSYLEPVLQMEPEIDPVGLGLFAGSLDPARKMVAELNIGPQGDFRDWEAIRAWATEIRPQLVRGEGDVPADSVYGFTDLAGDELREGSVEAANLRGANMAGADLGDADLAEAGLGWVDLQRSNLEGANLYRANLIGAVLRRANLRGATLSHAVLNGADLHNATLAGADLTGADLNWADLAGADLSGADLSKANLGWANFSGANLLGADLSNTRYNDHTTWPEGFDPATAGCIYVGGPR